ncbi:hypothetical protein B4U80_05434 [Leptotrombidium deliense]|uniref:Methyltransferase HEMK2 n=1 Tax=Leptotrombidium deliense TaxID=299467 RepID=A0A443SLC1_9ACAR|nr:hypothetical protein B4U80_05434 [Leptotrombidium deliense]
MDTPVLEYTWFEEKYNDVYCPAEDTFLLIDALEKDLKVINSIEPLLAVEIGCGSGIVSIALSKALSHKQMMFLGTDVNENAVELTAKCAAKNNVCNLETVVTNLVDGLNEHFLKFVDLVVFNPPYVVTSNEEVTAGGFITRSWAGGQNGRLVIDQFIRKAVPRFSSPNCLIYLVVIQENLPDEIGCEMKRYGFHYANVVLERRCKNERLKVLRFSKHRLD